MAVINVIGNYSIDISSCGDHEAREFLSNNAVVDKKTGDTSIVPVYNSIGHYSTTKGALKGIAEAMVHKKAGKKNAVTIQEWISIIKETDKELEDAIEKAGVDVKEMK